MLFAARRGPYLGVGMHEAHHRQDAQALQWLQHALALHRGAVEGEQEVHGDGVHTHLTQSEDGLHQLLRALAHAGDQAGAGGQAGALDRLEVVRAVLVAVCGADVGVAALGGVDVVVVGIGTRGAQLLGLLVGDESQAGAHLHLGVGALDVLDHAGDLVGLAIGWAGARGHHADALDAAGQTGRDHLVHLVVLEPRVLEDVGLTTQPLGAVAAVFGTDAALEVDEVVQFDPVGEELASHLACGRDEGEDLVIGAAQDFQCLFGGDGLRVESGACHGAEVHDSSKELNGVQWSLSR